MNFNYTKLERGDIVYEKGLFRWIKTRIIQKPVQFENQRKWEAKEIKTGKIINYLVTKGMEHYGPDLYREEQICNFKIK